MFFCGVVLHYYNSVHRF